MTDDACGHGEERHFRINDGGRPAHVDTFDLKSAVDAVVHGANGALQWHGISAGPDANLANTIGDIAPVRSIRATPDCTFPGPDLGADRTQPDSGGVEQHRTAHRISGIAGTGRSEGDAASVHFAEPAARQRICYCRMRRSTSARAVEDFRTPPIWDGHTATTAATD